MNKNLIIGIFLLSTIILLSNISLAETAEIKDTTIDYISYREVVVDDPGIIYTIKISNTGTREKDYEIVPDTEVIRNLGTYRIDPADKVAMGPGEQKTVYFFLAVEKGMTGRTIIPLTIRTGLSEVTLDLVARPVGPLLEPKQGASFIVMFFKVVLSIILIIIIIIALIFSFKKRKKEKKEEEEEGMPDFDEDVETYY